MVVHDVSVADLRRRLAEVLDTVEDGGEVRVTRRGKGVARVVSEATYDLLRRGRPDIFVAIDGFRSSRNSELTDDGWDNDLRDTSVGRPVAFED